jgi:NAD(P)H dehydrogenase (quinone)
MTSLPVSPRIAIIYYSATGHIYQLAAAMQQEALRLGAKVRLRNVREITPPEMYAKNPAWLHTIERTRDIAEVTTEDLCWADGLLFGTPTRFGGMAGPVKAFIDSTGQAWSEGKLSNKTVSSFTGAQNPHGGQEATLLAFNNTFYHWGCYLIPPGYTDAAVAAAGGNPYGTSVTATCDGVIPEHTLAAARYQCRRLVEVTARLVGLPKEMTLA